MRKVIKWCTIICAVACLLLASYGLFLRAPYNAKVFVTDDINDYGKYIGNYDNDTPSDFINSFFPASISNSFTDVKYHYKAKNLIPMLMRHTLNLLLMIQIVLLVFLRNIFARNDVNPLCTIKHSLNIPSPTCYGLENLKMNLAGIQSVMPMLAKSCFLLRNNVSFSLQ